MSKKLPIFYIFKSLNRKEESVLLAQSPFGMYRQVLGSFKLLPPFDEIPEKRRYRSKYYQPNLPRMEEIHLKKQTINFQGRNLGTISVQKAV